MSQHTSCLERDWRWVYQLLFPLKLGVESHRGYGVIVGTSSRGVYSYTYINRPFIMVVLPRTRSLKNYDQYDYNDLTPCVKLNILIHMTRLFSLVQRSRDISGYQN